MITAQEIKSAVNPVEFIGQYTQLRRQGREWRGKCPIHGGDNPSAFSLNPEGLWNCHACQKGGDLIRFVEEVQNIPFKAAAELLAAFAGLEWGSGSFLHQQGVRWRLTAQELEAFDRYVELRKKAIRMAIESQRLNAEACDAFVETVQDEEHIKRLSDAKLESNQHSLRLEQELQKAELNPTEWRDAFLRLYHSGRDVMGRLMG